MKKIISMLMTASLVLGLSVPVMAGEMEDKLVILHTNDIHGHYEKAEGQIGIAGVAALKDQYEAQGAEVLLLDAGDFSQGTTLVNHNKGINAPEYLIAADYDAVCLGNHEFDYGNQAAKDIVSALNGGNIPVLTANILKKGTTEPFFGTNKIFEMEGVKVGVFGLDTAETQTKAAPSSVLDMTFVDGKEMFAIAQKQVNELKEAGCEYIIALCHLGIDEESIGRRSIELAEAVTGIDLIIDGHSHTEMDGGEIVKDTMIVSAGCYLANIGTVVVDKETKEEKAVLIGASDFAANYGVYDEAVAQMVEADLEKVNEIYAEVFAKSEVDLNGDRDPGVRNMETNLSNLITDAYLYMAREYVKKEGMDLTVDMAVVNGGGTRAGIPAGEISRNHIFTVLPNRTTVVLMTVTGAQLLEALEASTFCTPMALGGFPQVAGMEYTLNTAIPYESGDQYPESTYYAPAKPGSRVTIQSINGKPFDLNGDYMIAVDSFQAQGGDTYYILTKASFVHDTGIVAGDALISYINSMDHVIGEEYASPQGRVEIIEEAAGAAETVIPETEENAVKQETDEALSAEEKEASVEVITNLYKVVAGDSLWRIAQKELGAGSRWGEIYGANKAQIKNPGMIYIGQELIVNK